MYPLYFSMDNYTSISVTRHIGHWKK